MYFDIRSRKAWRYRGYTGDLNRGLDKVAIDDEIDSANAIIRYGDSCVVCDLPEGYDELDEGERYYLACRWLEDQRGDEW